MYTVEKRKEANDLIAVLYTTESLEEAKAMLNSTATRIGRKLGYMDDCYSYKDQPKFDKPAINTLVGIFMNGDKVVLNEQPN